MLKFLQLMVLVSISMLANSSIAQTPQQPLTAWQLAGEVELPQSFLEDPDIQTLVAADKILVASPGLHTTECGSVTVNDVQPDGSIVELQRLTTNNFGSGCSTANGFGYAMDFADNVLVIGAPGQIRFAEGAPVNLEGGAIYIYRFEPSSNQFVPDTSFVRIGSPGDQAWGTRVATDGQNILVQSNETVFTATAQGNANPRGVNLITNTSSGWQITQRFTDPAPTMFGQDFDLLDGNIIINQHTFVQEAVCQLFGDRFAAEYQTRLSVYQFSQQDEQFNLVQSLDIENFTNDEFVTTGLDQILIHNTASEPLFSIYDGFLACGSFDQGHGHELQQYTIDDNNEVITTGQVIVDFAFGNFGPDGQDLEFPENQSVAVDGEQLLILEFDRQGAPVVNRNQLLTRISTPNGFIIPFSELSRVQRFIGSPEREFYRIAELEVNVPVTMLTLTGMTDGQNRVVVHREVPTLDPALTQTWWFGPEFSGQGVTFEVLADNRMLMYWLTFDGNGNQVWLRGLGELVDGEVDFTLIRPSGPQFDGALFDPADRVREEWGTATVEFDGCNAGTLRYNSDEFGSGELPVSTFIDLGRECGTGIITSNTEDNPFRVELRNVGSFYDPARDGEGLLLMPWPDNCRPDVFADSHACRLAYLLSYDAQGEQSWLGLGVLVDDSQENSFVPDCFEDPDFGIVRGCETILESLGPQRPDGTPRRPMGGIFGSDFDPAQVVRMPWGEHSQLFELNGGNQLMVFSTPDGEATLRLQQLTTPVGYR